MEKSKYMKQFEEETGIEAIFHSAWGDEVSSDYLDALEAKATAYDRLLAKKLTDEELDNPPASKILKEMAEKAEAYDRLMSGGKKTPKEWANFFGMYFCVDEDGNGTACEEEPYIDEDCDFWFPDAFGESITIPAKLISFTGDWKDSLTMPDGWEANHAK